MTQPPTPNYGDRGNDRVDPYLDTVETPVVTETAVVTETWTTGTDLNPSSTGSQDSGSSTKDAAAHEATEVKDTALEAGQQVAGTVKDQAQNVAAEAGQQTKELWQQTVSELGGQASVQQQRLATTVTSFSKELGAMASSSEQSGLMTDLAKQASQRGGEIAHWLEDREPKDLLEDVKGFARRRPFAFLAIAATAGVVAGRLTRGLAADAKATREVEAASSTPQIDTSTQYGSSQYVAPPVEPARENMSLQEVPTSGTGSGPTFYAPDADTQVGGALGGQYGRPADQGGVR